MGSAGGRDLAQLRNSLRKVPEIKLALENSGKPLLEKFATRINTCEEARMSTSLSE